MTIDELLDRAWSARSLPIAYRLGAGAPPSSPTPADSSGACDCSGFVAWAYGYNRFQPNYSWLVDLNGGWMNTDGIFLDTLRQTGLWENWAGELRAGLALVYPSRGFARVQKLVGAEAQRPAIGHVGIITRVRKSGPLVLHCSAGNARAGRSAIEETDARVFRAVPYTIMADFAGVVPHSGLVG